MKMFLLAFVAMLGIGFAAAPSLADNCGPRYRGYSVNHCQPRGHVHYHRPVVNGCTGYRVPAPVYGPRVVARPGFYFNGRNVAFAIGF
jgi:hypothetical protein